MSSSLKEILKDITTDKEAKDVINFWLSDAEKLLVKEQVLKGKTIFDEMDAVLETSLNGKRNKSAGRKKDQKMHQFVMLEKRWIKNYSPLVRAGILFEGDGILFFDSNFRKLFVLEAPASFLQYWSEINSVLRDFEIVKDLFDEKNRRGDDEYEFLKLIWGAVNEPLLQYPYKETLSFVKREDKSDIEKINILRSALNRISEANTRIPWGEKEEWRPALETCRKEILENLRSAHNLGTVPDSWVEEMFTLKN